MSIGKCPVKWECTGMCMSIGNDPVLCTSTAGCFLCRYLSQLVSGVSVAPGTFFPGTADLFQ